jgi:hypothetical protein
MHRQLSNIASVLALAIVKARGALAAWWAATGDQANRYRPEAHYMRGPGPKWRAKHAHVPLVMGPAALVTIASWSSSGQPQKGSILGARGAASHHS